jgi:hypothetical protein
MEDSGGPPTLPHALAETEKLMADPIGDPHGLLADYRDYLKTRIDKIIEFQAVHRVFTTVPLLVGTSSRLKEAAGAASPPRVP